DPTAPMIAFWVAFGALAVGDLAISARRRLAIDVSAPREIFSGERAAVILSFDPARPPPPGLTGRLRWPEGLSGPDGAAVTVGANGAPEVRFDVTARRRGRWRLDAVWLSWPSRLGLFEQLPRVALDREIAVTPNIRPIQSGQIDVQVRSALFGVKENALVGEGSDFHQLRDFVNGMDHRRIDWKRSARRRELVAKEMRAERNHHVVLALDNGYLMREEIAGLPKIDHQVNAALAAGWAAVLGGDQIGLFAFDARPRLYAPPDPGRAAFSRLRSRVANLEYRSVESNHTLAMAHLHQKLRRRSLVLLFSDFVDPTSAELLVENMAMLNRHHVIVFVTLRDPALRAVAAGAAGSLTGVARAVSAAQMLKERRVVLERLSRLGVLVIDSDPGALSMRVVSAYLNIKARELI
ncbi:MAG: DUF58 domain-containing protein, partial [Pseudomonadota bacterium]